MPRPLGYTDPNLHDLEFIKCPYCNKDIVANRTWHKCLKVVEHTYYVHEGLGFSLGWTADMGWWSFTPTGKPIEPMQFDIVANWVNEPDSMFKPRE